MNRQRIGLFAGVIAMPLLTLLIGGGHGKSVHREARREPPINPIQHVVIIMQENHSFDNYFGTYPGAEGIPMQNGVPTVCCNDPRTGQCVKPFYTSSNGKKGGPHMSSAEIADVDNGQMDGFLLSDTTQHPKPLLSEVMGYHDGRDIPNYWAYAQNFVLQDHLFAPSISYSLPAHLYLVSEWSANCTSSTDPFSCVNDNDPTYGNRPWTDLTYLLHKNNVSWAYYVTTGATPDSQDGSDNYQFHPQNPKTVSYWNPLPAFTTVRQDNQLGNIQSTDQFHLAVQQGKLPQVCWIVPDQFHSEHPPASIQAGEAYVTGLINSIMDSPYWFNTVIFVAWDDWGGFYDHFSPLPYMVDANGYGIRVPGLVISAYAKKGMIDHQVLSFDAYVKFIEDLFLNGQALDPSTDGRPDPRISVREAQPILGDLMNDFDFTKPPRPPMHLPPYP